MKKLPCILSVLLAAVMLFSLTAVAAESEGDNLYTVATTVEGEDIILTDAPTLSEIGALESYDLMIEDESVLTVEQSDVADITSGTEQNGYFSAEFTVPDTDKVVFIAGLSAGKVEEIQQRIIEKYAVDADFELEDLSFIDVEKTLNTGDGDDDLCWAAASSNILSYTGWAAQAGFETTDDVFENFVASFTDKGGNPVYGLGWFFNGVNTFAIRNPGAVASASAGTGGYLSHYAFEQLYRQVEIKNDGINGMNELHRQLKAGNGIALNLEIYNKGADAGGHSVTCWGYIADTAYDNTEPEYFSGLFLTDSDSDEKYNQDRRLSPNIMQAVSLTPHESGGKPYFQLELDALNSAVINEFISLVPYSDDIEIETSSDATRDKVNDPDLCYKAMYLDTDLSSSDYALREKIESNTAFYYSPFILNQSDVNYNGSTKIEISITDADGNVVYHPSFTYGFNLNIEQYTYFGKGLVVNNGLSEGDYTITVTLNGTHSVREAYYYNNTYTHSFKVRDSYLLGDVDNSGVVDVLDATRVQRIIAGFDSDTDEKTNQRGVIVGTKMNVLDATNIQRYIAGYEMNRPVGEKFLYD